MIKKPKLIQAATVAAMLAAPGAEAKYSTHYGIGILTCLDIWQAYANNEPGQLVLTAYIDGFGSSMNMASTVSNDVFGGTSPKVLAQRVFAHCRATPADKGDNAVVKTIYDNMKNTG